MSGYFREFLERHRDFSASSPVNFLRKSGGYVGEGKLLASFLGYSAVFQALSCLHSEGAEVCEVG